MPLNGIKESLTLALANLGSKLKTTRYTPLGPASDNGGILETFAKFNFSFMPSTHQTYVLDNDNNGVFVFIANSKGIDENKLFIAFDIGSGIFDNKFRFSNTSVTLPGIIGKLVSVLGASKTKLYIRTEGDTGGIWEVTTQGNYTNVSQWTVKRLGSNAYLGAVTLDSNSRIVRLTGEGNKIEVADSQGTLLTTTTCYENSWVDQSLFSPTQVLVGSISYGGGGLTPLGNDKYLIFQTRIFWNAGMTAYRILTMYSKFKVNADNSIEWILNPQTAGWKLADYTNPNSEPEGTAFLTATYNDKTDEYYTTDRFLWVGYAMTIVRKTKGNPSFHASAYRQIPVPDNGYISKASSPGLFYEVDTGTVAGTAYYVRLGTDSKGVVNAVIGLYNLVSGAITIIPNGLSDGTTFKKVTAIDTDLLQSGYCGKANNKNNYYYFVSKSIFKATLNKTTLNLEGVLIATIPNHDAFPANEVLANYYFDPIKSKYYANTLINVIGGGSVFYEINTNGTLRRITSFGEYPESSYAPVNHFRSIDVFDFDASISLFHMVVQYPSSGGAESRQATVSTAGVITQSNISPYVYVQSMSYSSLLNNCIVTWSSDNSAMDVNVFNITNPVSYISSSKTGLPAVEGLGGSINNGNILLGGFTTDVHGALARNNKLPEFTLPDNSVSYLYLLRVDNDKLDIKVSTIDEANTFSKAKIAEFTTSNKVVTSSKSVKITSV